MRNDLIGSRLENGSVMRGSNLPSRQGTVIVYNYEMRYRRT
jgi:hypothetical protein